MGPRSKVTSLPEFDIDVQACHGVCVYVSGSREERDKEKGSRDFLNTAKFVVSVQEDETMIVKEFILIRMIGKNTRWNVF